MISQAVYQLIIGIAWNNDSGWFTWLGLVWATALRYCSLIETVRTMGFGSDLLTIGVAWLSSLRKGSVIGKRAAPLVELHLIRSVHNSTTMLVLPLPQDRELPSIIRNNLQGPLLYHITSSINSTGMSHHNTITTGWWYAAMTLIKQLSYCAPSAKSCGDTSNYFPIAEVRLDSSIKLTAPEIKRADNFR